MLRISHERLTAKEVRLVVEGELLGPWVGELERTCEPLMGKGRRLELDLSQVLFADRAGASLLKTLARRGAGLDCSTFLAELLRDSSAHDSEGNSQLAAPGRPDGQG